MNNGLGDWQPIATAPKDGSKIIVYRTMFDGDYIPQVGVDWWGTFGSRDTWAKSRPDTPPVMWQPMPEPPAVD
jgi:hypothetical protein